MGILLNYPLFHADDGNGTPLVGGLLYTYIAGTTTEKSTYTTRAMSTANANPVVLNTRGDAVVYGVGNYKLLLKDADGVTIWTQDNCEFGPGQGSNAFWVDPSETDQGAAGNGSSLKDILDAIGTSEKCTVYFAHSGASNTTTYTVSTTYDASSYTNVVFIAENGALISVDTGITLTLPSPSSIVASSNQQIFSGAGTVSFSAGGTEVYPEWWYDGSGDYHDAILAAVVAVNVYAGTPVKFSGGTYTTAPISFQGYNNVYLKGTGNGSGLPSSKTTTLQFTGAVGIGLQFSDTTNPTPAWRSDYARVEDMYLNGGGTRVASYWSSDGVPTAINYSRGAVIRNVCVRDFSGDGIIQEDNCDVANGRLDNVESSFNGGDGFYIRGTTSTIMNYTTLSATNNGGYGLNVEGGAGSVSYNNATLQGNKIGGLKIYKPSAGTGPSNLSFENLYTEGNGIIGVGNPGYEGDWAVLIDSYDATSSVSACPNNILFKSAAINKSTSGGMLSIQRVYGVRFISTDLSSSGTIGTTISLGQYAYGIIYESVIGSAIPGDSYTTTTDHLLTTYPYIGAIKGTLIEGMWLAKRGRTQAYTFYIANPSASTTALMDTYTYLAMSGSGKGYPMPYAGSILAIVVQNGGGGGGRAGVITVRPLLGTNAAGFYVAPSNALSGTPTITMDLATEYNSITEYAVGTKYFNQFNSLGVELATGVDYVDGTHPEIMVTVFVEY